jgi:hypothetical protein
VETRNGNKLARKKELVENNYGTTILSGLDDALMHSIFVCVNDAGKKLVKNGNERERNKFCPILYASYNIISPSTTTTTQKILSKPIPRHV